MNELLTLFKQKKSAICEKWLQSVFATYSLETAKFLGSQKDRFHNPVGHTLASEINVLYDELIQDSMNIENVSGTLENILRIRAVQDFSPSQAVAFVFQLKKILHEEIVDSLANEDRERFAAIMARIDQLALMAFDIYARQRERIFDIRLKEIKKWSSGFWQKENQKSKIKKQNDKAK